MGHGAWGMGHGNQENSGSPAQVMMGFGRISFLRIKRALKYAML
jgi:hypothetical protein